MRVGSPHIFPVNLGKRFQKVGESIFYKKILNDSIFEIKDKEVYPRFKFDYKKNWTWNNPENASTIQNASHIVMEGETVFETLPDIGEKYIMVTSYFNFKNIQYGIMDRQTLNFYRLDLRRKNKENFKINFMKWEKDRLISFLEAYDIEEFLENLDDDQYSIAGGLKYEDFAFSENPVLLRIKFKVPD